MGDLRSERLHRQPEVSVDRHREARGQEAASGPCPSGGGKGAGGHQPGRGRRQRTNVRRAQSRWSERSLGADTPDRRSAGERGCGGDRLRRPPRGDGLRDLRLHPGLSRSGEAHRRAGNGRDLSIPDRSGRQSGCAFLSAERLGRNGTHGRADWRRRPAGLLRRGDETRRNRARGGKIPLGRGALLQDLRR